MSSHFNFLYKRLLLGPSSNTYNDQKESPEIKDPLPNTCGSDLTFDAVTTFCGETMFFKDK